MDYNQSLRSARRGRTARLFFYSFLALLVLGGGGALYTVFFTNTLRFSEIVIRGTNILAASDIFSSERNPYLFQKIIVTDPLVASVSVYKDFFDKTLTLEIEERTPHGIWCGEASCFWFDKAGLLFAEAPAGEGGLVKSVYDTSGRTLQRGAYVLPQSELKNLFAIFEVVDVAGVGVIKFSLPSLDKQEFHAVTAQGAELYFSLRYDPLFALEALQSLKPQLGTLEYIDFRSENRVFYQ